MTGTAAAGARSRLRPLHWLIVVGLLAPAMTVTVLRIVQPTWLPAIKAVSFAPYALLAYLAVAVALLARWALRRDRPGPAFTVTCVLALAGLGLHLWWIAPQFTGNAPPPGAGAPLRVMNLNLLKGSADAASLEAATAGLRVDVLVVEEVTDPELAALGAAGFDAQLPHHAGAPAAGVTGTMVFSRYPLRVVGALPTRFGSVVVDVDSPAGPVRLYAIHACPPVDARAWDHDLRLIADRVAADAKADLVVGDFNATPDHVQLRRFDDAGFRSAAEITDAGWQPSWPDNGHERFLGLGLPRLVQIDHVLVAVSMTATATWLVHVPGTDHAGVVAEVAFR
jgi:endonuclease/exonuclease/phosphatase (EEP) superfamily protein YafD